MSSFISFAVALSYGLAVGSVVFVAGLKMIGADDAAAVRAQLEPTIPQ
jgi:hypothetical protein